MTLAEILALAVPRGWFLPVRARAPAGSPSAAPSPTTSTARTTTGPAPSGRTSPASSCCARAASGSSARPEDAAVPRHRRRAGTHRADPLGRDPAQAGPGRRGSRWSGSDSRTSAAFFALAAEDQAFEYTVAWVDCLARGRRLGRGIYMRGDHAPLEDRAPSPLRAARLAGAGGCARRAAQPAHAARCSTRPTIGRQLRPTPPEDIPTRRSSSRSTASATGPGSTAPRASSSTSASCPSAPGGGADPDHLRRASAARASRPRWRVLKRFGDAPLARPALVPPGGTHAGRGLRRSRGRRTLALLDDLDAVVRDAGGAVYPAKDARMSPESFRGVLPRSRPVRGRTAIPSSPPRSGAGCMPPEARSGCSSSAPRRRSPTETARVYAAYGARLFLTGRQRRTAGGGGRGSPGPRARPRWRPPCST